MFYPAILFYVLWLVCGSVTKDRSQPAAEDTSFLAFFFPAIDKTYFHSFSGTELNSVLLNQVYDFNMLICFLNLLYLYMFLVNSDALGSCQRIMN